MLSHPNILGHIAVEVDNHTGECLMVSEYMVNGNIVDFVRYNSANRLRLVIDLWFSSPVNAAHPSLTSACRCC